MYNKEQLNNLYERIAKAIDISDDLFDAAETEYTDLGVWIDKETPTYKISIYPQGSFALGTVIKPIKDNDDYDLDLVCEFERQYGLSAKALKHDVVKPLLERYRKVKDKIVEKKRCWHVEYEDVPNFHMDIIPAIYQSTYINITDHDEEKDLYNYIGSNPKGYVEWFNSRKAVRRKILVEQYYAEHKQIVRCQADVEKLKEYNFKTPLQKAIQLLKRHRDIMFNGDADHRKPVSIIITTIAAQLYGNEDNIVDTLENIMGNAEQYIKDHMIEDEYHIDNPCYTGGDVENFADKWNKHPERANAFFEWLKKAKVDLIDNKLYNFVRVQMADNIKKSLGENTGIRVFNEIAEEERKAIASQQAKIVTSTGAISTSGSLPIPESHHHGA